jgi:hypothetical protein
MAYSDSNDDPIRREAIALWLAMFDAPPPEETDGCVMLDMIVRRLEAKDYVRLYAADSARGLTWPRPENGASLASR